MIEVRRITGAIAVTAVLIAGPPIAPAASSPDASEWLGKLAAVYERMPLRFRYDADLRISQDGQITDVKVFGRSTQAGRGRLRVESTMQMPVPGSEPPQKFSFDLLGVSDGSVFWFETVNPMTRAPQVVKIPLDKLEAIVDTNPMARNLTRMDPLSQITDAVGEFDFEVAKKDDRSVTLRAVLSGENLERAKSTFEGVDPTRLGELTVVIDAQTGFPTTLRLGSENNPGLEMRLFDFEMLDEVEDDFSYSPPEGAVVLDMGAMLEAGPGQR